MRTLFYIITIGSLLSFTSCNKKTITVQDSDLGNDIFYYNSNVRPFSGTCKVNYENSDNTRIKMQFRNGKMNGRVLVFYEDGSVKTKGFYKNGMLDGKWESWYPNGEKYFEANYMNDSLHGEYTEYHDNGVLKETGYYTKNGKGKDWNYFSKKGNKVVCQLAMICR